MSRRSSTSEPGRRSSTISDKRDSVVSTQGIDDASSLAETLEGGAQTRLKRNSLLAQKPRVTFASIRESIELSGDIIPQGPLEEFCMLLECLGDGKLLMGWRRHFDSDGDGELNFGEFCSSLGRLEYKGDVLSLWTILNTDGSSGVSIADVHPPTAQLLADFKEWTEQFGGAVGMFEKIDYEGNQALSMMQFVDRVLDLGVTEEDADLWREELFPAFDMDGLGCISPEELLFLETDPVVRQTLRKDFERKRRSKVLGFELAEGDSETASHEGDRMLHNLTKRTTLVGNMHWKSVNIQNSIGGFSLPEESQKRSKHQTTTTSRLKPTTQANSRPASRANSRPVSRAEAERWLISGGNPEVIPWVQDLLSTLDRTELATAENNSRNARQQVRKALSGFQHSESALQHLALGPGNSLSLSNQPSVDVPYFKASQGKRYSQIPRGPENLFLRKVDASKSPASSRSCIDLLAQSAPTGRMQTKYRGNAIGSPTLVKELFKAPFAPCSTRGLNCYDGGTPMTDPHRPWAPNWRGMPMPGAGSSLPLFNRSASAVFAEYYK